MLCRHAVELKYAYIIHRPALRRRVLDADRIVIHVSICFAALQRLHLNANQDVLEYELNERVLVERRRVEIESRNDNREWRV